MSHWFAEDVESRLSQGDVFAKGWDDRTPSLGSVIVISEGCEIDKAPTVLVAPLEEYEQTEPSLLNNIRAANVYRAIPLPELDPPRWGNLRETQFVEKERLLARLGHRERSMSEGGRMMMAGIMFSFLTLQLPPNLRLFRDSHGLVWDVWRVSTKNIRQIEDQFRRKLPDEKLPGWLVFSSSLGTRRLFDVPDRWEFLPDSVLEAMLARAEPVDAKDALCLAADQSARPRD